MELSWNYIIITTILSALIMIRFVIVVLILQNHWLTTYAVTSIRLFGQDISVSLTNLPQAFKSTNLRPDSQTGASSGSTLSCYHKIYTEEELKRLKFKFNEDNQLSQEQLREIKNPMERSRHSSPNAFRTIYGLAAQTQHRKKFPHGQTNAEYVEHCMTKYRQYGHQSRQQHAKEREKQLQETGQKPLSYSQRTFKERKRRAQEVGSQGVITFKKNRGSVYEDPKGRTGEAYWSEVTAKRRHDRRLRTVRERERRQKMRAGLS